MQPEQREPAFDMPQSEPQTNRFSPPGSQVELKGRSTKLLPYQKAGRVIHLMAWLGLVATVAIGVAVLLPSFSSGRSAPIELVVMPCLALAFVVALFFVARAVMRRKTWGRYAGIIYGLVSLLGFPIGTLVGGYVLWQLVFGWAEGEAEA